MIIDSGLSIVTSPVAFYAIFLSSEQAMGKSEANAQWLFLSHQIVE